MYHHHTSTQLLYFSSSGSVFAATLFYFCRDRCGRRCRWVCLFFSVVPTLSLCTCESYSCCFCLASPCVSLSVRCMALSPLLAILVLTLSHVSFSASVCPSLAVSFSLLLCRTSRSLCLCVRLSLSLSFSCFVARLGVRLSPSLSFSCIVVIHAIPLFASKCNATLSVPRLQNQPNTQHLVSVCRRLPICLLLAVSSYSKRLSTLVRRATVTTSRRFCS